MPTFIDMSALTKRTTLTGNEEFQVSATEKVTAQQIADLASSGLNVYTISESESQNQKIDASRVEELKKSVLLLFPNETNYTPFFKVLSDNSKAYFITGNIPFNSQGDPGINNGEEPPFEQVNSIMIKVDLTTYDIAILPYPIISKSWLKGTVQVTAFTESALSTLLSNYKTGDFIPFYTGNVTASADNQFPESGAFNGFISMGSNEGDYCQIFAFKMGSPKAYLGACIVNITQWTELGGGGTAEPIVVADAESVATVVAAAFPKFEYGKIRPIYIEATSDIYDQLPAIQNVGFISGESTICGYAQCVYDGGDYYHIGIDLLLYPSSGGFPKYRAELVITNSGDIADSSITPIGSYLAPIPGFTKIASETDFSMTAGSMGIINFNTEVTSGVNVYMFVMAEVRSSAAPGADVRSVAIPLTFFNPVQGATVFDLNTRTLTSGTNIAQVKLNVASVVTGANGVQGLNCIVTSNNLANTSDILRIKAVYANI